MSWLEKIFGRDNTEQRLQDAHTQRDEAAKDLAESRELGRSLRSHDARNHLTDRMAAAFRARENRRHV